MHVPLLPSNWIPKFELPQIPEYLPIPPETAALIAENAKLFQQHLPKTSSVAICFLYSRSNSAELLIQHKFKLLVRIHNINGIVPHRKVRAGKLVFGICPKPSAQCRSYCLAWNRSIRVCSSSCLYILGSLLCSLVTLCYTILCILKDAETSTIDRSKSLGPLEQENLIKHLDRRNEWGRPSI